jgi:hypothetical protein
MRNEPGGSVVEGHDGDSFQVEIVLELHTSNGEAPSGETIRSLLADRLGRWVSSEVELRVRRVLIRPRQLGQQLPSPQA